MKVNTIATLKEDIIDDINNEIYRVIKPIDFVIKHLKEINLVVSRATAQKIIDDSIEYYEVETFEEIEDYIIEKIKERESL
jgi:hypothetical protein